MKKNIVGRGTKAFEKAISFSSKEKIVLFVGRLDTIKGIEMLIMSFQDLLQKRIIVN